MEESDRNRITSNIPMLCPILKLDTIIPFLIHKNIFSTLMINDILSLSNENDRKVRLLTDLCRRGPDAYDKFVDVLLETGHNDAIKILRPSMKLVRTGSMPLTNKVSVHRRSPNISPNSPDEPLVEENRRLSVSDVIDNQSVKVKPALTWMESDDIYPMFANPRGYCLIFNNVNFDNDAFETRHGSDTDAKLLDEVFQELGFKVVLKRNIKASDMKRFVENFTKKDDLRHTNAFVMIVLSHGNENVVYGSDNLFVNVFKDLVEPFNNKNCPNLINIPKLFFFQACRGTVVDFGVTVPPEIPRTRSGYPNTPLIVEANGDSMQTEVKKLHESNFPDICPNIKSQSTVAPILLQKLSHLIPGNRIPKQIDQNIYDSITVCGNSQITSDAMRDSNIFNVPNCATNALPLIYSPPNSPKITTWSDILISYPTVFGYVALRNPEFGSWYCSSLVWALIEHASDSRLIDILALVDRRVQEMQSHGGDKQSTSFKFIGWNKKFYFNPGLYK